MPDLITFLESRIRNVWLQIMTHNLPLFVKTNTALRCFAIIVKLAIIAIE
jgi:hypothetical protein